MGGVSVENNENNNLDQFNYEDYARLGTAQQKWAKSVHNCKFLCDFVIVCSIICHLTLVRCILMTNIVGYIRIEYLDIPRASTQL